MEICCRWDKTHISGPVEVLQCLRGPTISQLSYLEGRNNENVDMPQVSHIVIVSLLLHRCWVDIVVTHVSSGCLDQEGLTLGMALTFTLNV